MSTAPLVLLAAGRARRYGGLKPLSPVGPNGEAVIDLLASDALAAGFDRIVVVIAPSTGGAIRYHIEQTWPRSIEVAFATQQEPRGTVDALRAAYEFLGDNVAIGVANGDDVYGQLALSQLAEHLASGSNGHGLIAFCLAETLLSPSPVTRGLCEVNAAGYLVTLRERRNVARHGDGTIHADDGAQPELLDPQAAVSVNLWGFAPGFAPSVVSTMERAHGDGEVLLPELVDAHLSDPGGRVLVRRAQGPCIGVTHPEDLAIAQRALARMVSQGLRPPRAFEGRVAR